VSRLDGDEKIVYSILTDAYTASYPPFLDLEMIITIIAASIGQFHDQADNVE
jgi:hypothetical protein